MICVGDEEEGDEARVRTWGQDDLEKYEKGLLPPRLHPTDGGEAKYTKRVREMVVLGSCLDLRHKDCRRSASSPLQGSLAFLAYSS